MTWSDTTSPAHVRFYVSKPETMFGVRMWWGREVHRFSNRCNVQQHGDIVAHFTGLGYIVSWDFVEANGDTL